MKPAAPDTAKQPATAPRVGTTPAPSVAAHATSPAWTHAGNLAVQRAVRSPGQPLPSSVRNFFEPRFGADFSQVRVHTDAAAQQSAQDINANAYTVGPNIVFGRGRFAPETEGGRRLLAHELTHTLQQTNGVSVQLSALMSHRDDPAEREAESVADNSIRAPENAAPPAIRQPATSVIQRDSGGSGKAGFGNQPHAVTDPGFGSQPPVVKQPGVSNQPGPVVKAGFGNKPRALTPKAGDEPADDKETLAEALAKAGFPQQSKARSFDIRWSPADNIERFKKIWSEEGRTGFEDYAHDLLQKMWNTGGADKTAEFADEFWNYVWKEIGGQITSDPDNQMMVGIAATIVLQQKRVKEVVEERKRFIAAFEEEARRYTREVLQQSQERVLGELKHYFGASWIRNYFNLGDDPTTQSDDRAARKALGIAAAGLVRRRDALIKANAPYRDFVRRKQSFGSEPIEAAVRDAGRDYEVFRLQVVARFPILEEISSPEIDAFRYEDAEPDDAEGQQLKTLAKMAQDGNMAGFEFIVTTVREKLSNIEKVRKEIEPGGDINIWRVPELVQGTRDRIGVKGGSAEAELIDRKFTEENRPRNESEGILGKILFWGGLVLALPTKGLSLVPFGIYEATKVGIAVHEHVKEYQTARALHGTDFGAAAISAEDPSLFWLAGDILNAGLAVINLAPLAGPAVRLFRRLAPFARLAREVQAGEAALITLKNEAHVAARLELKLGADEASAFAETVVADARAARSGKALGMTADEARMLEQAEARAVGSQSRTGYSRTLPGDEDSALAAGRMRRRARPFYANDPLKKGPGAPKTKAVFEPDPAKIDLKTLDEAKLKQFGQPTRERPWHGRLEGKGTEESAQELKRTAGGLDISDVDVVEGGVLLEQKTALNAADPKAWAQTNITEKYEKLIQLRAQIAREFPEYEQALIGFRFKGTPDPKFWDEVYNAKEALEKKYGIEIPIDTGG